MHGDRIGQGLVPLCKVLLDGHGFRDLLLHIMNLDVTELRDFYARPLGHMVRRILLHRLRARTRQVDRGTVIGLGFATPYLNSFRGDVLNLGALMPATQGAIVWPAANRSLTALVDEAHLPLADNSVDLLLGIHCLEAAERPRPLLREIWRVLKPEGRLILIVPNRTSIWARLDSTPFGHGRPFSRAQLMRLLGESLFSATNWSNALHVPPIEWPVIMRSATSFERVGAWLTPGIGGVMLVEAHKEIAAPIGGYRRLPIQEAGGLVPAANPSSPRDSVRRISPELQLLAL